VALLLRPRFRRALSGCNGERAVQRLFVEKEWIDGDRIRLPNKESHYLSDVLRLGPGGMFQAILDGEAVMEAALEESKGVARILASKKPPEEAGPALTLIQAQLKAPKMAWLVQKATELGVSRLLIATTERTIPRPRGGRDSLERWKVIAREAAEQCGATRLPRLEGPLPLAQALADSERSPVACPASADLRLLLWEGEAPHLKDILKEGQGVHHVALLVGPEGGFSSREVETAQAAGFIPASLGPRVLRAETAAIAALAILRFVSGS